VYSIIIIIIWFCAIIVVIKMNIIRVRRVCMTKNRDLKHEKENRIEIWNILHEFQQKVEKCCLKPLAY